MRSADLHELDANDASNQPYGRKTKTNQILSVMVLDTWAQSQSLQIAVSSFLLKKVESCVGPFHNFTAKFCLTFMEFDFGLARP